MARLEYKNAAKVPRRPRNWRAITLVFCGGLSLTAIACSGTFAFMVITMVASVGSAIDTAVSTVSAVFDFSGLLRSILSSIVLGVGAMLLLASQILLLAAGELVLFSIWLWLFLGL